MKRFGFPFILVMLLLIIAACIPVCAEPFPDPYVYVTGWGGSGNDPGEFDGPSGIDYGMSSGGAGYLYVADTGNHRIQKFRLDGSFVREWGSYGGSEGEFIQPADVAFGNGFIYVADMGNNRIQKFTNAGRFVRQWGGTGSAAGKFNHPTDIAVDLEGNVYVCDRGNNRVQKFTSNGAFIRQWGMSGTGEGQFRGPSGIACADNQVYVVDKSNRTQVFNRNGRFQRQWSVLDPAGIDVFPYLDCEIFVTRYSKNDVCVFNRTGVPGGSFGGHGSAPGKFSMPSDVVMPSVNTVFILDKGNNRVQEYSAANPIPEVTSLSPSQVMCDSDTTGVVVQGRDFTSYSFVVWRDTWQRLTTNYASSTRLVCWVPASCLGIPGRFNLTVRNPTPGGGLSGNITLRVTSPEPHIDSIAPSSRAHGGNAFNVTITGTGFIPESRARWNGSNRAKTYHSSTELEVRIRAADIETAGTATISVKNPNPGGGISNGRTFTVT